MGTFTVGDLIEFLKEFSDKTRIEIIGRDCSYFITGVSSSFINTPENKLVTLHSDIEHRMLLGMGEYKSLLKCKCELAEIKQLLLRGKS
jgi:hypothetical protein